MRTPDAQTLAILRGRSQAHRYKFEVEDAGGTWRDLADLYGRDWLDSLTRERSVEQGWAKLDVGIKRSVYEDSLSPLMTGARANSLGGDVLLALGRRVRLSVQIVPSGEAADPSRWAVIYEGYIEHTDPAGETIKVESRDLGSLLDTTQIESELAYGIWRPGRRYLTGMVVVPTGDDANDKDGTTRFMKAQNTGVNWGAQWQAGHVYAAGAKVIPTRPNGYCYQTTAGGTSGTTEPIWPEPTLPEGAGATVVDGSATWVECTASCAEPTWPAKGSGSSVTDGGITWKEQTVQGTRMEILLQGLIDDALGPGVVTLYTPTSPDDFRRDYLQEKTTLYGALKAIVDLIGWSLYYDWDEGTSAWRLTLQAPGGATGRTEPTVVDTLTADDYEPFKELSDDLSLYRTRVKLHYFDRTDLGADGLPTPKVIVKVNAAAEARLGRRLPCEIQLAATDGIDTPTEADTLATNILADLSNELITTSFQTPLRWWMSLNDFIELGPDDRATDVSLSGAISTIRDVFQGGDRPSAHTEFTLRAMPSTGQQRWLDLAAEPNAGIPPNKKVGPRAPVSVSAASVVGGVAATWETPTDLRGRYSHTEVHIGSAGFTPGPSTLKKIVTGKRMEHTDGLTPGNGYALRLRHVDAKGNAGDYSPEVTFTAGQAQLVHLHPDIRRNLRCVLGSDLLLSAITDPAGAIILDTVVFDSASAYNATTGVWTVPTTGKYQVRATTQLASCNSGDVMQLLFRKAGSPYACVLAGEYATSINPPSGVLEIDNTLLGVFDFTAGDQYVLTFIFAAASSVNPGLVFKAQDLSGVDGTFYQGCALSIEMLLES
jgi:hypothetical protein